ncbi:rho family-interacting cell polarization regulator 1 isoform X1 [Corvus hawaiiensis]|uniref:rho family-interacting cell polarization regulator 1 isoform X1 n=3 Tax=Corvus hawaiiensis TaxID=134902 RepID=UPI0020194001|nr:rho family-interacting cell polarization regulator 1 isoform X1 [Corvus hawaiiensis]
MGQRCGRAAWPCAGHWLRTAASTAQALHKDGQSRGGAGSDAIPWGEAARGEKPGGGHCPRQPPGWDSAHRRGELGGCIASRRGRPSRSHSTMSLSVRPQRRVLVTKINRSQSFAGVNSSADRPFRNLSAFTPTVSRKTGSRVSRMFSMSHKSPPPKVPQPNRLDEVYEALKKGLTAYLEVHQLELEKLSTQIRESKRNSRLGFLYDLDKQVKSIERFLRRLEFHASKIDELYEAYCIQRRLRDGAHNMVKAYSTGSPGSREARESLAEASKGYKEYTENMCLLENELESQLGEFHIRMKGLAGFARLCAGDQYEIFMKYGRQRWKLRGRIEVNSKQVWDSEEMVFLPLVTEFLSIKVTELKSLANHVVVGNVSCETKDLFAALPQVVAVDINDLGTLKLSLEVTWNPFDKDDQPSAASSVNKASTVNKRFSTYNQSPPDTPSLREQAFYSPERAADKRGWSLLDIFRETLFEKLSQSCSCGDVSSAELGRWPQQGRNMLRRQEELENGTAWSISSESSDDSSSPQLSGSARHATHKPIVQPEVQASAPAIEISFSQQPEEADAMLGASGSSVPSAGSQPEEPGSRKKETVANGHVPYSRTLSHISEASVDATMEVKTAESSWEPAPSPEDTGMGEQDADPGAAVAAAVAGQDRATEAKPRASVAWATSCEEEAGRAEPVQSQAPAQSDYGTGTPTALAQASAEERPVPTPSQPTSIPEVLQGKMVDSGLEEAIGLLGSALDDYRGQFPELQPLERELKRLEEMLLQKQGIFLSRASSISLTVEHALESFSFLNTSDMEDSEGSEEEPLQDERRAGRPLRGTRAPSAGEMGADDTGMCSGSEASTDPMSTGNEFLDKALVLHLNNCNSLLLKLGTFGPLRCQEMYALDRLLRESQVLEMVCQLTEERAGAATSAADVVQFSTRKEGVLPLWDLCVEVPNVYTCPVERFLQVLSAQYAAPISEQHPGLADAVCVKLVEDVLNRRLPRRPGSAQSEQVTIFQYWSHFESLGALVLDTYMMELAEEALLAQNLNSDDQDVVLRALKRVPEGRLKKEGLKALSLLLVEGNSKVVSAVSAQLRSLAENPRFRQRALVCFLEQLEDEEVQTRVAGCAALGCLKAKESIEQLVYLCQTDKEPVREAAKQSLMLCGEDGKSAHRRLEETLDSLPRIFAPASMASTAF